MGGGARAAATPCATSPASSSTPAQVSGVEMKDLKSLADEAKQSLGSGVVGDRRRQPRTARRAWSSRVTGDLDAALQRRRSRAPRRGGARRQGRRRPPRHGAGRRPGRRQGGRGARRCRSGDARRGGVRAERIGGCPNRARRQARFALASEAPLTRSRARGLTAARGSGGFASEVLLKAPAASGRNFQQDLGNPSPHRGGAVTAKRPQRSGGAAPAA